MTTPPELTPQLPPDIQPPPIAAVAYAHKPAKPKWLVPIGVISIVFGSLGLLSFVTGIFMTWTMSSVINGPGPGPQPNDWLLLAPGLINLSKLPRAAVLLAAGIAAVRRKAVFITLARLYFILAALQAVLVVCFFAYYMLRIAAPSSSMNDFVMVLMILLNIVIQMLYPSFLLYWTSRRSVREQIRQWDPGRGLGKAGVEETDS